LNNFTFFSKFKEENCLLYEKIKSILTNLNLGDIIYFDEVDVFIREILTQYSLLERQLLLRYLISENFSQFENSFEIFSKFPEEKDVSLFLNKTTLEVLNLIKNSNGSFELYEKNERR
jgi:hypothetical protein